MRTGWSATLKANLRRVWMQVKCMHEFEFLPGDQLGMLTCMQCNTTGYDEDTHAYQIKMKGTTCMTDTTKPNLDKVKQQGPVNLEKGKAVSLTTTEPNVPQLTEVRIGLGWDPKAGAGSIDLDASALGISDSGAIEVCYYSKLELYGGAIQHSGDNLTGDGAGDDEVITVKLNALPADIRAVVFTVNSFSGDKFDTIASALARVFNPLDGNTELARVELSNSPSNTGVVVAALVRNGSAWDFKNLTEYQDGKTGHDMVARAKQLLAV